jgi:NADPH2:quinone reductase
VKAIIARAAGPPDVLRLEDTDVPTIGPREVLVEVAVAGVNFADIVLRRGGMSTRFPHVPGVEGAGTVVAVGAEVGTVSVGDRVAYCPVAEASAIGSYAQLHAVAEAQTVPLPDGISFDDAAALLVQGLTAHYLVNDQCPVGPGVIVLVHAAAGGTGALVTRWLKHLGATVVATVSSEAKEAVARAAGADHVVRYDRDDFAAAARALTGGRGVDYVIDGVGQSTFEKDLEAVRIRGHICLFGRADGFPAPVQPFAIVPKSITLSGGYMVNFLRNRDEVLTKSAELWHAVSEGWLRPTSVRQLPLADAADAHRAIEDRSSVGKLTLAVPPA